MKKLFLSFILFFIISVFIIPTTFGILKALDDLVERINEPKKMSSPHHLINYTRENIDAELLFKEQYELTYSPVPIIGFRIDPYQGKYFNIDKLGQFTFRRSINQAMEADIWFFGGSTMEGAGSSDNTTIPSYFAKITGNKVINFGVSSYSSRQELDLMLNAILHLKKPKQVVFYDGYNDISTHCDSRLKLIPQYFRTEEYFSNYTKKLSGEIPEHNDNPLFYFVTYPYKYIYNRLRTKEQLNLETNSPCLNDDYLKKVAKSIVEAWLTADSILQKHGIEFTPVLQPNIFTSTSNKDHLQKLDDIEKDMYLKGYRYIKKYVSETTLKTKFISLDNVLNDEKYFFYDNVHLYPNGNRIIAEKLSNKIN